MAGLCGDDAPGGEVVPAPPHRRRRRHGDEPGFGLASVYIAPLATRLLGVFARRSAAGVLELKPRIKVLGNIFRILRQMWEALAAFLLGYGALVFIFACFYGAALAI